MCRSHRHYICTCQLFIVGFFFFLMYEAQTLFFLLRRESIQVQPRTTDSRMGFHSGLMLKKLVSLLSPAREELGLKLATGDFGFSENLNKSIQYQ